MSTADTDPSATLLERDEPAPAMVRAPGARAAELFVCDHAGRAVPRRLGDLGAPAAEFERHIAWDLGAWELTLRLADAFKACAIGQRYSRLVIDCNRDPARADAMPAVSDGAPIPANAALTAEGRAARVAAIHAPYHAAIASELAWRRAGGLSTRLILVHSFTPRMGGRDRPWRYGVLHLGASPLSHAALAAFAELGETEVGDNEPYAMNVTDYTAPRHGIGSAVDYLELEVRQDLLADAAGVARVAALLGRVIARAGAAAGSPG